MLNFTPDILQELLGMDRLGRPDLSQQATWPKGMAAREERGVKVTPILLWPNDIPALRLEPATGKTTGLGVLYCHAHGNNYAIGKSEAMQGRPAILNPPLAMALAQAGATVICPDMPGFGDRQPEGSESELAKAALWRGDTLLGKMVADLHAGYLALAAEPAVDAGNIQVIGLSMGGTLAYVYAALNPAVAGCVQMCVFADVGPLISDRAHDQHCLYMTIPGLLPRWDMGDIAGLVAPRPQLICTGAQDSLTPEAAYRPAAARVAAAYRHHGAEHALHLLREEGAGHHETPAMRCKVLGFLGLAGPMAPLD